MAVRYTVVLCGFSAFERSALGSYFRLSADRSPSYRQVASTAEADFVVADADQPLVCDELRRDHRLRNTVFIGSQAPPGAVAWTMRPIDPLHVLRQLDALAAQQGLPPPAALLAPMPPAPWAGTPTRAADRGPRLLRRASDSQPGAFDDTPTPGVVADAAATRVHDNALLVDDSEIALRFLERQLHALGLATRCSTHSTHALELLAHERFDFVFIDVELGEASDLDGLALCQHIKHRHRHARRRPPVVVMLSAHATAVDRVRGTLAGCDAYLGKPLDGNELRHTLQRHGAHLATGPRSAD